MNKKENSILRGSTGIYNASVTMGVIEAAMKELTKKVPTYIVHTSTNLINEYFPEYKLPPNYPCIIKV